MAVPPNIAHAERTATRWPQRRDAAPLLVLDPRVPGQRPDSPLGSVLGRPSAESRLSRYFAAEVIARGVASMAWAGVPGGVFDAADGTVDWTIAVQDTVPVALVRTAVVGPRSPAGIPVALRHNGFHATGTLDENGRAARPLVGEGERAATVHEAWDADWSGAAVTVGVDVEEGPQVRDRVRQCARHRLTGPQPDAYLAEILAAGSDY
jgi:hypothetical protein